MDTTITIKGEPLTKFASACTTKVLRYEAEQAEFVDDITARRNRNPFYRIFHWKKWTTCEVGDVVSQPLFTINSLTYHDYDWEQHIWRAHRTAAEKAYAEKSEVTVPIEIYNRAFSQKS